MQHLRPVQQSMYSQALANISVKGKWRLGKCSQTQALLSMPLTIPTVCM